MARAYSYRMKCTPLGEITGYKHRFATLSFGGVIVRNAEFIIALEKLSDMYKEKPTGSQIAVSPF